MSVKIRRVSDIEVEADEIVYEAADRERILRVSLLPQLHLMHYALYLTKYLHGIRTVDHNNWSVQGWTESLPERFTGLDVIEKLWPLSADSLLEVSDLSDDGLVAFLDGAPLDWVKSFGMIKPEPEDED